MEANLLTPILDWSGGPDAERRLFSRLRLAAGIRKTTVAGRLAEVDDAMVGLCEAGTRLCEILDVGASSGTTSLEWLQRLEAAGHAPQLTATDLSLRARLLTPWRGYRVLVGRDGQPLQHELLGRPVRTWKRRLDYLTQGWLIVALGNWLFARAASGGALARAERESSELLLVSPAVAAHPRIELVEEDIFAPNPPAFKRRFQAVRAANLLLPDVFDGERLRRATANLKERLAGPGALLIIARSPPPGAEGGTDATIFELGRDDRLRIVRTIGKGSELTGMVLAA